MDQWVVRERKGDRGHAETLPRRHRAEGSGHIGEVACPAASSMCSELWAYLRPPLYFLCPYFSDPAVALIRS